MKSEDKKQEAPVVAKPEHITAPKKESSGDKKFDDAIDRMLKRPYQAPAK
jgi:hypothetical protein